VDALDPPDVQRGARRDGKLPPRPPHRALEVPVPEVRSGECLTAGCVQYFRRVLAGDAAAYEAAGWKRVAEDWSDSVGPLALMEWSGAGPPEDFPDVPKMSHND
jgi:hypothetical protein